MVLAELRSTIVLLVTVVAFIASLKVAVATVVVLTPPAPLGDTLDTVGGVVSDVLKTTSTQ